jgi:hypothetical protein
MQRAERKVGGKKELKENDRRAWINSARITMPGPLAIMLSPTLVMSIISPVGGSSIPPNGANETYPSENGTMRAIAIGGLWCMFPALNWNPIGLPASSTSIRITPDPTPSL